MPPLCTRFPRVATGRLSRAAVLAFLLGSPPLGADSLLEVPYGFRAEDVLRFDPSAPFALQLGGLAYSPAGDLIVYEGGEVRLVRPEGDVVLARFAPPVFGSFLVVSPAGDAVLFGESSEGKIYEVALDASGAAVLDQQDFVYDLAFAPPGAAQGLAGKAFVSALGPAANSIFVLDGDPGLGNDEVVGPIPQFSGPLAFDARGNLYYATAGAAFAGEIGQRLVRFSPDDLAAGLGEGAVDFARGEVLARDLGGIFALRFLEGRLYLSDLGFAGPGGILVADPADDFALAPFATLPAGHSGLYLAAREGEKAFAAGTGPRSGRLAVAHSDFVSSSRVGEIVAELFFVRGRVNGDEEVNLADAVALARYLFSGGPPPDPLVAGDVNDDSEINLTDAIFLLNFLFRGGERIPPPYPDPGPAPR